jgi:hypothetical protein
MRCPRFCARLRPSAVRVRIKVARRQRPSPSATVPPQTDHRPSTGGRGWCASGAAGPKCRHGTDRPAPGEIGPLAYRTRTLFCARKPRCRPATAPSPGPATDARRQPLPAPSRRSDPLAPFHRKGWRRLGRPSGSNLTLGTRSGGRLGVESRRSY